MKKLTTVQLLAIIYRIIRIRTNEAPTTLSFSGLYSRTYNELQTREYWSMSDEQRIKARYMSTGYAEIDNTTQRVF